MALHIKKIKPLNNYLVVTGDKYQEDMRENGIIIANKGDLKLYQKVLAVGQVIRGIEVGDQVMIDPTQYAVMRFEENSLKKDLYKNQKVGWNLPWVTLDDENGNPRECLLLTERDIKFVFEGEEVNESIIIPEKPTIITN